MQKEIKKTKKLKFWQRRRWKIFLILILILGIAWFFYAWYFKNLPQVAISLFDEIPSASEGQKIIVFSPHPDDETISLRGYIKSSIENKARVWIVLITDGNKHHLESQRYEEFLKTTRLLGVPEENLFFY
jgi:hypothetical protein